jgi:hypothetical protein
MRELAPYGIVALAFVYYGYLYWRVVKGKNR